MTTIRSTERLQQPRPRVFFLPKLALRRRSSDHPMAMFVLASGMALMSMAFASASGSAVAALGAPAAVSGETTTSQKQDRLQTSPKDMACHGQTWGAESDECLLMIAREAGRGDDFKVRKLASADAPVTAVF
jgi:hypothetical protein